MSQRIRDLEEVLALLVQKGERLCDKLDALDKAELDHKTNWDAPVGSETWLRGLGQISDARLAIRHDLLVLNASIREAKDALNIKRVA